MSGQFRSGYVSLIGRPNVGKSTLLNVLIGQKIAIVSDKPQTTRNRILGIKTLDRAQIIFVDTPGIHRPEHLLGQRMVRTARSALKEIDVVLFLAEAGGHVGRDREILESIRDVAVPVMLVINKIDRIKQDELLQIIGTYRPMFDFREIVPVSAINGTGTDKLIELIVGHLPEGPKYYPDDEITDRIERFMVSEIIREKIMEKTSEEVPHSVAVEILGWEERQDGLISINADIYVERDGQKGIIIGKQGSMLKSIGTLARSEIERLLDARVFLQLWVKVRKGWRDDKRLLNELGYE